jgi:hypothetical protein
MRSGSVIVLAFLTALTTEHFVLQTAAGATVSEAATRASLYLLSLSSSLVAMGFAAHSQEVFLALAAALSWCAFSVCLALRFGTSFSGCSFSGAIRCLLKARNLFGPNV